MENVWQILRKSSGPPPCRVWIASMISISFPTASPQGTSMSVRIATVSLPAPSPMATIFSASRRASSRLFIKAPLPTVTSSTILSLPAASFLLIMDAAINGMLSTVLVTSRRAYSFLSAGAIFADWPMIANPKSFTVSKNASSSMAVARPGIDSSLSIVPPVNPRPRPLILATLPPHAATSGPTTRVVLSPTPPVLCLSTLIP